MRSWKGPVLRGAPPLPEGWMNEEARKVHGKHTALAARGNLQIDAACTRFKLDETVRNRLANAMRNRASTFKASVQCNMLQPLRIRESPCAAEVLLSCAVISRSGHLRPLARFFGSTKNGTVAPLSKWLSRGRSTRSASIFEPWVSTSLLYRY